MKKNVKALIACCAALVVVGGGYAAVMLTGKAPDSSSTSSVADSNISNEPIAVIPDSILSFEKTDITSISVTNQNGGYEAVPTGKTNDSDFPEFTVKGIEKLDINTTITASLLNSSSALGCDDVIEENPENIEKYGLSSPQAEVTVKTSSETKKLIIGSESPTSGETYCMIDGENTVYLAATSSLSVFTNAKENFLSTSLIPAASDGNNPTPQTITIERDDLDYDIVLELDESKSESEKGSAGTMATHYMKEPVFSYLDVEKSQDATQGFFGLSAYSAVYAYPTQEQKEGLGLDKPFCTVSMTTTDGESHTLKIGNKMNMSDGDYYAFMLDDVEVIYAVSAENLCWAVITPGDITSKMIFGTYVWDIGKLEINVNGGENVLFTGSGDADNYQVTKNGVKCDSKRFQDFYKYLLKTSAEDFVIDEQPKGEPTVSIELETQKGTVKQKVEFYKADGMKSLIVVNGTPCFKCRTAYVDLLIQNLSKFDTTEDFVMNW